jgi:hypothetical protein
MLGRLAALVWVTARRVGFQVSHGGPASFRVALIQVDVPRQNSGWGRGREMYPHALRHPLLDMRASDQTVQPRVGSLHSPVTPVATQCPSPCAHSRPTAWPPRHSGQPGPASGDAERQPSSTTILRTGRLLAPSMPETQLHLACTVPSRRCWTVPTGADLARATPDIKAPDLIVLRSRDALDVSRAGNRGILVPELPHAVEPVHRALTRSGAARFTVAALPAV